MGTQRSFTEKLLFDYYLVSSVREGEVASRFPFYLDEQLWQEMQHAALVLDDLVRRLITSFLNQNSAHHDRTEQCGPKALSLYLEPFPYLEQILALQLPLLPFFWVRFDAFVRPTGGIFFSEFNYDKPCAQREILYNNLINPQGNPNANFAADFVKGIRDLWSAYNSAAKSNTAEQVATPSVEKLATPTAQQLEDYDAQSHNDTNLRPTVGILVDPNHYEELHLAYLYQDLLAPAGFPCIIAGGKNFKVVNNQAYAFDQPVDIILRQYPTEHSQELENYQQLLELYATGHLLMVNDPRSILGQGKALFATLWELAESSSELITAQEQAVIRQTIPRTWLYSATWDQELLAKQADYVLKGNYSRYSEEVYIGRLYEQAEWVELLEELAQSAKTYVVQEFCSSEPWEVRLDNDTSTGDCLAYGNFGVYLINGRIGGLCVRWSPDLLTSDESWFSPIGLRTRSFSVNKQWTEQPAKRQQLWQAINDQAAFELDYTGGYSAGREAFSLDYLALPYSLKQELFQASERLLQVFSKVLELVQAQPQLLCPVLGIDEPLAQLVVQRHTSSLGLLGRLDWVIDHQGNPKLLEYNAETPAGLLESTALQHLIAEMAWSKGTSPGGENTNQNLKQAPIENPNQELEQLIRAEFKRIIQDFSRRHEIKTIGFVSASANEDWYHTRYLMKCVQDLPYNFVYGEISGLRTEGQQLWLYDTPLDAIYRYYPLDWLEDRPRVLTALGQGTLSINPVHTYILQSKAFLALVQQLAEQDFFEPAEQELIYQYLPSTFLRPLEPGAAFVLKPYFAREGQGVICSEDLQREQLAELLQHDVVFQERVFIQQVGLELYQPQRAQHLPVYPVLGIFTVGDKAAGVYTRAGAKITGTEAVFLPTVVTL